jgi:seryl-tRNA synthetase
MLDLKYIRENTEVVRRAVASRRDNAPIDEIVALDITRREKVTELEELRRQRKLASKQRQDPETGRRLRDEIHDLEETVSAADAQLRAMLLQVPNIPQESVPVGDDETANDLVRSAGVIPEFAFTPKPHWELGEALDIIDFERGSKLSGSRFYVLKGLGARLQHGLINFMLERHTRDHGYTEIYPPFMVKKECLYVSSNLPKFADNLYHDAEEDYWFVPTAEVPLTNLHRDEIIAPGVLPIHYAGYTACFRREKMSAGKDTRGIKRGHQFDKVELYKFCAPENSNDELETMTADAERICTLLGLPLRIVALCTAEIGFASSKSYDIEVWAPGIEEWLEVSSCSNCLDFQARRGNIRYRPDAESKPAYVHTLNGSGLALPRIMIALMENYQQADGSIRIPDVLQDFMGTSVIR